MILKEISLSICAFSNSCIFIYLVTEIKVFKGQNSTLRVKTQTDFSIKNNYLLIQIIYL